MPAPLDGGLGGSQAPTARSSLPSLPSHFVNREAELGDAMARIQAGHAVVAVEGAAGIGKSATATELAHRLRDPVPPQDGMPDLSDHTFLWVPCGSGCPSLRQICADLAQMTGDQALSTVADDQKLNALRVHMAVRKTVLLLDDLKLADDPNSEAIRQLTASVPDGSLVITSMDRPHELQGSRIALQDLEPRHVMELIHAQVDALDLQPADEFDEQLAERLQAAVGGNPGMIEWFLRSFSRSYRSLEDHLRAVERGETSEERVASLWSDLAPSTRTVLAACALLEGNAIAEQLATACDLGDERLSPALQELIDLGLVAPVHHTDRPSTFACQTAIGRYALSKAPQATVDAFTSRLVAQLKRHFAKKPEDAGAAIPYVGSLQPIMQRLHDHGNDADLQALFRRSLDILFTLGLFDHRIALGRIAYESAMQAENHRGASLACEVLSSTHAVRGEVERAREAVAWGLLAAERSGHPAEKARQMRCTGLVSYRSKDAKQALADIEGADELARETGEREVLVNVLGLRTAASRYVGDLDGSRAAAEECLTVCEDMPWYRGIAYPLRDLAEIEIRRGDFEAARVHLERARTIATASEDKRQLARISMTDARMNLLIGDLHGAKRAGATAQSDAARLGLSAEALEARAIYDAARRAQVLPPLRLYYMWRRPPRLSGAPA